MTLQNVSRSHSLNCAAGYLSFCHPRNCCEGWRIQFIKIQYLYLIHRFAQHNHKSFRLPVSTHYPGHQETYIMSTALRQNTQILIPLTKCNSGTTKNCPVAVNTTIQLQNVTTMASQMKTSNIFCLVIYWTLYGTAEQHGWYGVLIHDSHPDVRLFHSLLRGDFPSQWLQLLQCPLVSPLGVPDRVEDSLLQN